MVEDISAVKDEGRLGHGPVDGFVIQINKERPLGQDGDGMGVHRRRIRVGLEDHPPGILSQVDPGVYPERTGRSKPPPPLLYQSPADIQGGGFPGVAGVGFEGAAEKGDPLARHGVEHGRENAGMETGLLDSFIRTTCSQYRATSGRP